MMIPDYTVAMISTSISAPSIAMSPLTVVRARGFVGQYAFPIDMIKLHFRLMLAT
jgi:hypothetical protein